MPPLNEGQRRKLEKTVERAREVAELGARAAIEQLAVHRPEPFAHLSADERDLRNRLRARARQLGDRRDARSGEHQIDHLVVECAYEHWHRMLFARFLAENNVLMHPDGVAVTLEECEELAPDEGAEDGWELAGRYAAEMLPRIFRPDAPVLEVKLPPERQRELERLLSDLPPEVFKASDSLGWVYQFWQAKKKDEVNKSEVKIGADELPAVTQLFTEPYMVQFLLHNTLGAWWVGRHGRESLPLDMPYLRFVEQQHPAAADMVEAASSRFPDTLHLNQRQDPAATILKQDNVEAASSRFSPKSVESIGYFDKKAPIGTVEGLLPHWRQEGVTYFVTFRTADSLPQDKLRQWQEEKKSWMASHPEPHDSETRREFYDRFPERLQRWIDRGYGACLLRQPKLRTIVEETLKHFDGVRYHLGDFIVAANHVHAIVTPLGDHRLSDILHSWKSYSANRINAETGRRGSFWQKETFDHIVRSPAQLERIKFYIQAHNVEAASSQSSSNMVEAASSRFSDTLDLNQRQDAAATIKPEDFEDIMVEAASSRFSDTLDLNQGQDAAATIKPEDFEDIMVEAASSRFSDTLDLNQRQDAAATIKPEDFEDIMVEAASSRFSDTLDLKQRQDAAATMPAAGTFDGWPDTAAEIKVLDPCCGSGHFLVAAFEILVHFRMAEEKLKPAEACDAVLRDNIHGLEIDERCTQIAAFALALAAWTFPGAGGYRVLPEMHIACSGLAPRAKKSEWLALAGDDMRLRNGMERLYELFQDAPVLGSLIDPTTVGMANGESELFTARFSELRPLLDARLDTASCERDAQRYELSVAARGIVSAAQCLSKRYSLVVTNVPYLKQSKQSARLKRYCLDSFPMSKADLATVFLQRCVSLSAAGGTVACVTPQNWLYLTTFTKLRRHLLRTMAWRFVARLGPRAFETISGEVVSVCLFVAQRADLPLDETVVVGVNATEASSPLAKNQTVASGSLEMTLQGEILGRVDSRIGFEARTGGALLQEFASAYTGQRTGDFARFGRKVWEFPRIDSGWVYFGSTVSSTVDYGGLEHVMLWEDGKGQLAAYQASLASSRYASGGWKQGWQAWNTLGVRVSQMGDLPVVLHRGEHFDNNTAVIVPQNGEHLPAIWCFCSSPLFRSRIRKIDQALKVTNANLVKIPFDLDHWQQIATEAYPNGLPRPYSPDPTQWIFHGHPADATEPLQVAVARLLGYRWPAELDEEMELSEEARTWVARARELDDLVDDDGIVCLPAVRGEQPAATRLQRILARAFGDDWSPHKQAELLAAVGCKGWTLERWLQDKFFAQHCKVFQNRPFIWHIWDGLRKGGFSALVNYHKLCGEDGGSGFQPLDEAAAGSRSHLGRALLETLTYNYLGDWIRRQQDGVKRGEDGAADRLAAAKGLQEKLKLILKGEPPCDIFVRWKPIEQQPMGWDPDINDGVRVNIRPFMLVGDVGKKGAGVLRDKPNIKWGKDRGKDPPDAPWYQLGPEYGFPKGTRINDHHLTLAEKQAARDAAGGNE